MLLKFHSSTARTHLNQLVKVWIISRWVWSVRAGESQKCAEPEVPETGVNTRDLKAQSLLHCRMQRFSILVLQYPNPAHFSVFFPSLTHPVQPSVVNQLMSPIKRAWTRENGRMCRTGYSRSRPEKHKYSNTTMILFLQYTVINNNRINLYCQNLLLSVNTVK